MSNSIILFYRDVITYQCPNPILVYLISVNKGQPIIILVNKSKKALSYHNDAALQEYYQQSFIIIHVVIDNNTVLGSANVLC